MEVFTSVIALILIFTIWLSIKIEVSSYRNIPEDIYMTSNKHKPMQKEFSLLLKSNYCAALIISLTCFIKLFNLLLQKVLRWISLNVKIFCLYCMQLYSHWSFSFLSVEHVGIWEKSLFFVLWLISLLEIIMIFIFFSVCSACESLNHHYKNQKYYRIS